MNEYYGAFEELQDKDTFKGQQWFGERQDLVEEYSWAVPNEQALVYLSEFEHLWEIGAGNGYWAQCIRERDGSVHPVDANPPEDTYVHVEQKNAQQMFEQIEDAPVLMVWPPHGDSMAARVADSQPSHILYVGEPRGGCTGDEQFFDIVGSEYGLVAKVNIPSYAGINDDLFHYVRKI